MAIKRIGVLTGGGDCPGLNPAIKWVVKTAMDRLNAEREGRDPMKVYGIHNGWEGLLKVTPETVIEQEGMDFAGESWMRVLTEREVRPWDREGGTRLGSSRTNPFKQGNDQSGLLMSNLKALELDALVAIGGEDTQSVTLKLSRLGFPCIGIPKTIDKDLPGTDYSLGFDTAVQVITEEIDRLCTTAGSHSRTFVVETMGRHAGHLALQGGVAGGAYIILIPEHPFNMKKVAKMLTDRRGRNTRYSIVVASEGSRDDAGGIRAVVEEEKARKTQKADSFGHMPLGGVVHRWLAGEIEALTGMETRGVELSHLQRGGRPSNNDRRMGREFGIAAVDLLLAGKAGRMVSLRKGKITHVDLEKILGEVADMPEDDKKREKQAELLNIVKVPEEYDPERYNAPRQVFPRDLD